MLKRNKLSYLPTIATYWNYSRNALGQKFNLFNFEDPWFKTSLWVLNMNVPIFDAGQKAQRIRQAKLNLEKTSNTIENLQLFWAILLLIPNNKNATIRSPQLFICFLLLFIALSFLFILFDEFVSFLCRESI